MEDGSAARLRQLSTPELTPHEITTIRELLKTAFGHSEEEAFTEDDWQHAIGGRHFVLDVEGDIRAHAAVVERELHVGDRPLRTGYVEAVATAPAYQRRGFGTRIMRAVASYIRDRFELGALGTGSQRFYERMGWMTWKGPSFVRTASGNLPTPDEDGYILVLPTPSSPALDLSAPISCEWRPGDAW